MSVFDTDSNQTTDGSQNTESAFQTETQPQDSFLGKLVGLCQVIARTTSE